MTRLTSVTVEGFKGIDRIEFDPGRLNVVTGRNNSGKTSLLEALNLTYDPSSIARFGPNLDTVVNRQFEQAVIEVETNGQSRELRLEQPSEVQVPDVLIKTFQHKLEQTLQVNHGHYSPGKEISADDISFAEIIRETDNTDVFSDARSETILVGVDGSDCPYVQFGPVVKSLYMRVIRDALDDVGESTPEFNKILSDLYSQYSSGLQDSKQGLLVGDPPDIGTTNFVDFNQLASTLEFDEDDADPVKVDDIGDFLRDHGILEDLKTFDVDHLVFESEDGEKYSVPFEFMGEGFKTIVGVLWELLGEEQDWDLVLLEEPETHMHPGYVRELVYFLVQLAREEDVQLFVTTHNNDFLNDFFEANFTEDEQAFLEDEFRLLQLQDGTADVMDYAEAEEDLKDLKLDLRGL